jgi:hypothetical protein
VNPARDFSGYDHAPAPRHGECGLDLGEKNHRELSLRRSF